MPFLYAHRGASSAAPENTPASFAEGWAQGADGIECDVHLTRDGEVAVIHDARTGRVAGRDLVVADTPWAGLRDLDVGSWKDPRFAGERIPLLREVLAAIPPGGRILIEVKSGPATIGPLAGVLAAAPAFPAHVVVMSFDAAVVAAAAAGIPGVLPMLLVDFQFRDGAWTPSGIESVEAALRCGARGLGWRCCPAIDAGTVAAARAAGMTLSSWTVNDPAEARRLAALGLDALTTDQPARIRAGL
ncbi:MAG: glycerophosphodiester phosphodiesterase family protein [Kiritimatiellia bacterium]